MTKFFFKFKKPIFGPFPQFWGKISFSRKIGFLAPWQNPEKSNDQIPRKQADRCQEGRMDRPDFIGSFQLPLGG